MYINILTLFPDYFKSNLKSSMLGNALSANKATVKVLNIRDFSQSKHKNTDDRPYGGGPGMVMMIDPIKKALDSLDIQGEKGQKSGKILLTSAKGSTFTQTIASDFSKMDFLTIICGHYEGVDERVAEHLIDSEIRIGDYVLTGGEPAAMVISDAVIRLIPGVLGNDKSNKNESHSTPGQLGFPQYTRPPAYNGWNVPEILLTGHHAKIEEWREQQKEKSTI